MKRKEKNKQQQQKKQKHLLDEQKQDEHTNYDQEWIISSPAPSIHHNQLLYEHLKKIQT